MYELLILISAGTDLDLRKLDKVVTEHFASQSPVPELMSELQPNELIFSVNGFKFYIRHHCGDIVSAESKEMAERFAKGRDDADEIASVNCRFEVSSDDDLSMDHFNDFVFLMEAIEKAGGVYIFDPASSAFM